MELNQVGRKRPYLVFKINIFIFHHLKYIARNIHFLFRHHDFITDMIVYSAYEAGFLFVRF